MLHSLHTEPWLQGMLAVAWRRPWHSDPLLLVVVVVVVWFLLLCWIRGSHLLLLLLLLLSICHGLHDESVVVLTIVVCSSAHLNRMARARVSAKPNGRVTRCFLQSIQFSSILRYNKTTYTLTLFQGMRLNQFVRLVSQEGPSKEKRIEQAFAF